MKSAVITVMLKRMIALLENKCISFGFGIFLVGMIIVLTLTTLGAGVLMKNLLFKMGHHIKETYRQQVFNYKYNIHSVLIKEDKAHAAKRTEEVGKLEQWLGIEDKDIGKGLPPMTPDPWSTADWGANNKTPAVKK